ncbi:recombinase family protein [Streptomyces sp. AV19]|nr:recombinase family protein [Streptomyces sp. AV19]MBH1936512.1 recombinase family protein [Streptomyces sp. AV19]MDG4532571.1 recombinase family protein [Streptomyces sp. AV19]
MDTNHALPGILATETLRGVRCIRLSVLTDETTSPERQREAADLAAASLGILFGEGDDLREAVDLDVSASKTSPFDRPQLGMWLSLPDTFDALVFWRFDRAIRSMADMHELAKWARAHRKILVFAEGVGGGRLVFDFRNPMDPMAELQMVMLAFAAQVEAQNIKERVTGAQAAMRTMALRWRGGGQAPYGYMPAPMPAKHGGSGWTLVPDPEAVKVIKRIIAMLLEGKSPKVIAQTLNTEGVLSPNEHWAALKARLKHGDDADQAVTTGRRRKKTTPAQWRSQTIIRMLRRETLLGWKMHKGKPVRDNQGNPIMITETPILERKEFDQVGALLAPKNSDQDTEQPSERKSERRAPERKDSASLLLRVIHCSGCGGRMYYKRNRDSYVCASSSQGTTCSAPVSIRAPWVDEYVSTEFLRLVGPVPFTRTREIPGYDPQPELNATLAEYEAHIKTKGDHKDSKALMAVWDKQAAGLRARIRELESREKTEPRREIIPTGRTYADDWHDADAIGKRAMLVEAGARLTVCRGSRAGWRRLDTRRVNFTIKGDLDPVVEEATANADGVQREDQPEHAPTPGTRARLTQAA